MEVRRKINGDDRNELFYFQTDRIISKTLGKKTHLNCNARSSAFPFVHTSKTSTSNFLTLGGQVFRRILIFFLSIHTPLNFFHTNFRSSVQVNFSFLHLLSWCAKHHIIHLHTKRLRSDHKMICNSDSKIENSAPKQRKRTTTKKKRLSGPTFEFSDVAMFDVTLFIVRPPKFADLQAKSNISKMKGYFSHDKGCERTPKKKSNVNKNLNK